MKSDGVPKDVRPPGLPVLVVRFRGGEDDVAIELNPKRWMVVADEVFETDVPPSQTWRSLIVPNAV